VLGFVELAQLSLASTQQSTGDDHPNGPGETYGEARKECSRASNDGIVRRFVATLATHPGANDHASEDGRARGAPEPDFRSLHTNLHLLKRVSVNCPWPARHNFYTSLVHLKLHCGRFLTALRAYAHGRGQQSQQKHKPN
jgi:hypothetical protein